MTSQKRKEKQKLTLLQKAIQNCLSTNEPPTNSHSLTHSFDLQMIYRFHQKLSNLKKHPTTITNDNVPNKNNRERIKTSKYFNGSFNGILEKNQPKYIDFPKILFGKSSRSFSLKWHKEFPWLHYNLDKDAASCYTCMSAAK